MTPTIGDPKAGAHTATRLVKPTEGQLRYAQFHFQRKAQSIKDKIDVLHQTPLLGEGSDISTSGTDTSDVELRAIRMKRPKISKGRRTLLKHSRKLYLRRKEEITKHGYKGYYSEDEEDEITEELDEIFLTRKRNYQAHCHDKSYRRFQAACHAMMKNIQTSQPKLPTIEVPTKKWKRSKAHMEASSTDFYRYKTSGLRGPSNRNAALLLSYEYYQQNQKEFSMDKGASWLTHIPAKQKDQKAVKYYLEKENHENIYDDEDDGNESSVTLAMRQPGPQKFHRLMAYVQHKLLEKESQPKSRTREMVESIEQPSPHPKNRIRQMAESIEGKTGTPTMTLHSNTPFSSSQSSRRKRRLRYVPRMRLGEFAMNSEETPLPPLNLSERLDATSNDEFKKSATKVKSENVPSPPTMKLKESKEPEETKPRTNERTRELASTFEKRKVGISRIKELRASLEPDKTPTMKLKRDFIGQNDEKKETEMSGPNQGWMSPSSDVVNEFSSNIDPRIVEQFQDTRRESSETNVTEFFARLRTQQQRESLQDSPESDALSETSKNSNLSGLWSRGRNSLNTLTSNLNTIAENQKAQGFLSPELIGKASNVSGRMSGLLNKFRGHDSPDPSEEYTSFQFDESLSSPHKFVSSPSGESHAALRAYRQNRASMSPEKLESDALSHASSYHELPEQIRQVIQNSGGKPPSGGYTPASPNRTTVTQSTTISQSELSDEQYKRAHGRFLQNSALLGGEFQHEAIIDTDGTQSDASGTAEMDPQMLAKLMMSPDILQKRLKQAIHSIEEWKWDQVLFLINANPWLAEMKELTTNQYLLHKLAFYGKGSPTSLSEQLLEKFPAAVYKFDQDGNVPLHLAAASSNLSMIKMLGEKFEGGASIRNEDGMLPLHFTIASLAESLDEDDPLESLKTVLKLFPKAVAIADNDGNLPIHVASECLEGAIAVDTIYCLIDEAEHQLEDPFGARFRNKVKIEDLEELSDVPSEVDSSILDAEMHCTMVLNEYNETPLMVAIRSNKGWEIIEALVNSPGGSKAALAHDANQNNALHLLVGEFQDATAAMSILKVVPESAIHRNAEGILPIEMACMHLMPEEVILAIALVDLPVSIDGIQVVKDRGASWTFLTCDSDDHMVHVVEEIVSICSFQQLQELCYWQDTLDKATPKCKEILHRSLRFLGRFEFVGEEPLFEDPQTGFKAFEALDFGADSQRVLLECYGNEFDFENRVYTMFDVELDNRFIEEVNVYVQHLEGQEQRCVAIERPRLTLDKVVENFSKNGGYYDTSNEANAPMRLAYSAKICSVLRLIGKALNHLHSAGVVHGNVCMETCGKFEDSSWKLLERLDVQSIGKAFDPLRFSNSFPPESIEDLEFTNELPSEASIDIWGFGKLCYESLVGKALVESSETPMVFLSEWSLSHMESVFANLLESGIGESGAEMITSCLFPQASERPKSMEEILENPFWQEIRKHRSPRKQRKGRTSESVESTISLLTDVDTYEV